jgi:hypothetical protein
MSSIARGLIFVCDNDNNNNWELSKSGESNCDIENEVNLKCKIFKKKTSQLVHFSTYIYIGKII